MKGTIGLYVMEQSVISQAPDWISAIGTAVAALTTIPLWIVSWRAANAAKRSADAADLSARAAMWIELPLIIGSVGDMLHVEKPVPFDGPYGGQVISDIPDRFAAVTDIALRNHGRSVASLELLRVGYFVGAGLPAEPSYSREYPCDQNMVIPPGEREEIDLAFTIEITPEQRAMLVENKIVIWMYAEVTYRDFLDAVHRCGLAWRYHQPHGGGGYYFEPINFEAPNFRYRT